MQRWEYRTHVLNARDVVSSASTSIEQVHRELADLGHDGWDLFTVQRVDGERGSDVLLMIFKRPAPED